QVLGKCSHVDLVGRVGDLLADRDDDSADAADDSGVLDLVSGLDLLRPGDAKLLLFGTDGHTEGQRVADLIACACDRVALIAADDGYSAVAVDLLDDGDMALPRRIATRPDADGSGLRLRRDAIGAVG